MREYKTKAGRLQLMPTLGVDVEKSDFDDDTGWCLFCGNLQYGVEPDARKYTCDDCEENKVYGLAELALMGLVDMSATDK